MRPPAADDWISSVAAAMVIASKGMFPASRGEELSIVSGPRPVLHKPSAAILPVGGSNFVSTDRVLGVFEPSTAAVKRLIREAKTSNKLIDVSRHREVRSVLVLDTGDVVTSFLTPEDLAARLGEKLETYGE